MQDWVSFDAQPGFNTPKHARPVHHFSVDVFVAVGSDGADLLSVQHGDGAKENCQYCLSERFRDHDMGSLGRTVQQAIKRAVQRFGQKATCSLE